MYFIKKIKKERKRREKDNEREEIKRKSKFLSKLRI